MALISNSLTWNDRPEDLTRMAATIETGHLLIEWQPGTVPQQKLAELRDDFVVFFSPLDPVRRPHRRLPFAPGLNLLAGMPDRDPAVAVSRLFLKQHEDLARKSQSLCEFVVRSSAKGHVAFVELANSDVTGQLPKLTNPGGPPENRWLADCIHDVTRHVKNVSATSQAALKAGMFLLNDFFDDSHSCSQSIEGLGTHHTGDYWHAILHRREPDYGNSKYWFRHVGRHPIFDDLATYVQKDDAPQAGTLRERTGRLIADHRWDPFAFVDLCEAAERDVSLKAWCERIQYEEMLRLLEWTVKEAGILPR